ncbi:ABC transporter permease [Dorea sp. D27]|uniref:ABC transporter permease n=1 Tax=Dorea sp. D27 TaxID=658665 RepID=UPI0006735C47|nr:ABC transporter permease [Dorea sp. D27]KMZ55567.1 efflux ABC transporter, permease protein [Dorea sp. D27]
MLKNNNGAVITKLAKRSMSGNKRRNMVIAMAILLSSFLLFTILTVGITYIKMQARQNMRMKGAVYDAVLIGGFTEQQKQICEENEDITTIGIEAKAGYPEETDADDTLHTVLIWSDDIYWDVQKEPAMDKVKGRYPTKDDEVMATKEALEDCGKGDLGIGDSFTMTYQDKNGPHTKEFRIAGMWEGYGDNKVFYVSKSFFDQSGHAFSDVNCGILYLDFKSQIMTEKTQTEFRDSLDLGKQQRLFFTSETEQSVQLLAGLAGLVIMTCLSAYLLIYNILYLSVAGNIRYYGLLQTIGMTGKQIRRLIQRQMLIIGTAGTAGGILLGFATSFFLIPVVVKTLGVREDVDVVFHPAVFLLSIAVVGITIYLGSRKPTRIADSVSPLEALGYRTVSGRKASHKTGRGSILWRMAGEQLGRDKKKTGVVILSLAACLSVFLCLVTMIESHGARTMMSNYMNADLIISNDTMKKEDESEWYRIIDKKLLSDMRDMEGVEKLHPMTSTQIIIPWEPEFSDMWMKEFYETWMDHSYEEDIGEYKQHPEKFYTFMTGIDEEEFDYVNSTLEKPVDKEQFLDGRTCLIYRDGLSLHLADIRGKKVSFSQYKDRTKSYTMEIGGYVDDGYYAFMPGMTPVVLVSDAFVDRTVEDPWVSRASVQYKEEYDGQTETQVKKRAEEGPHGGDLSYDSKIDNMKSIQKAQGNMMGVGIGITLILAMIGLMNYINTVSGNIQNRQTELSVMESVGMTEKQVKGMLIREGLLFAGISLFLTATVGLGVTYACYQSLNYMGIAFHVPVLPVLAMAALVTFVCTMIPLAAYRMISGKKSIVERIREL